MSEELIVWHCSPTLAGIKTGNLFSCTFKSKSEMTDSIRKINRIVVGKGLRVIPLRYCDGKALIYIFRPSHLCRDLKESVADKLLREKGYTTETPDRCIVQLIQRLGEHADFPHEIGLFLGYPPEDVCGFIENKDGFKSVGVWKVYSDVPRAEKLFEKYRKCTDAYRRQLKKGVPFERLIISVSA